MIRRPPRSTQSRSSAASDVYKRQQCPPCRSRVAAERTVRELIHARQPALTAGAAPAALRACCAAARQATPLTPPAAASMRRRPSWRARVTPYALAATLVLIVGGAFLYAL